MTDKVSPGSKVRGSPLTSAATVNGILDAAEDYTKRRQLGRGVDPIRKTLPTDLVRVRNNSGSDRRAGEVMRVGDAIIDEDQLTNEFLWFQGLAPNTSERFGILRKALPYESSDSPIGELQVSGVCKAWVSVSDITHPRAKVVDGSHVLESSLFGPYKILWAPDDELTESSEERECVVVLDRSIVAYVAKTDTGGIAALSGDTPGSGTVTLYKRDTGTGDLVVVEDADENPVTETVYNMAGEVAAETYIQFKSDAFGTLWVDVENCGE